MRKFALVLLSSLSLGACATQEQAAGTAAGAVSGALIAGPVGLVVGAAAGSVVTAPGAPLGSGWCPVYGPDGSIQYHSDGTPRRRHCGNDWRAES
jgi:osmotically inducible lipoprotein OsmB